MPGTAPPARTAGWPLTAGCAGGLASWLGPRNAMWIMLSAGLLPGALLLTPMFIRHRDLPQRPPAADGMTT